ncbi:MAG TPA: NAD(P)/FAD-dependent oxidoreductase, partial [Longimicrobiales bacterium]|nr:NAD(P)/FAD-dependent oxidoreductase [Longimicrobiales bacterium]
MQRVETVIVGGGQAGLAMSRSLAQRGVEHVVLERGRVGERWRSERWDSLHLLTPRWLSRLSDWVGDDEDPDGFMDREEVIGYLERYATAFQVPLRSGVTVTSVERDGPGFRVETNAGAWLATSVVVATGESQDAFVPCAARELAGWVHQVVPTRYRNPGELPGGGVLVVGASATGI